MGLFNRPKLVFNYSEGTDKWFSHTEQGVFVIAYDQPNASWTVRLAPPFHTHKDLPDNRLQSKEAAEAYANAAYRKIKAESRRKLRAYLLRWLPPSYKYAGVAIYPFIFVKKDFDPQKSQALLAHEVIHLAQQKELWIVPALVLYLMEYFVRLVFTRNRRKAYRSISFEVEAYRFQYTHNYLETRKKFASFKYLFRSNREFLPNNLK